MGTSLPGSLPLRPFIVRAALGRHDRGYVFAALVETVKTHSLGRISQPLYDVGGRIPRNT
jgi:hypothetical protein